MVILQMAFRTVLNAIPDAGSFVAAPRSCRPGPLPGFAGVRIAERAETARDGDECGAGTVTGQFPPSGQSPGETRREQPSAPGAAGPPGPGPTRREPPPGEDPGRAGAADVTRREDAAFAPDAGAGTLTRLPGELAARYELAGELPAHGAEADLYRARGASGGEFVVKVFRRGFGADPLVWRKLAALSSPHVVRIVETGNAGGRDFEVMEYLPAGNLRTLPAPGAPLPAAVITEIVRQLADGLGCLHAAGIVHRDLKPENVLVRSRDPAEVAVADFGLSKTLEESVVFASSSRTLAYAAPESLSGQVSPARDWWSLGVMTRELATGNRPFAGMTETAVMDHLATRPAVVDDVADPRLRLLCRGLLTRDPRRRWADGEVAAWLAGATPPVAEESAEQPGAERGLPFAGQVYRTRPALARALAENWPGAAHRFFTNMFTPTGPSEAWRTLREWLAQFDDPQSDDAEDRIRLVDMHLTGSLPPDVKLLHLLRWLDHSMPPVYLGKRVTRADLPALAALAGDERDADCRTARDIGAALWTYRLLPVLASFTGGEDLTGTGHRWQELARGWNDLARALRQQLPHAAYLLSDAGLTPAGEAPPHLLQLLALAADADTAAQALSGAAARGRAAVTGPVPWFGSLAAQAGGDPLRLLAVTLLAPLAAAEAATAARRRREAELAAQHRRKQQERREQERKAGRRKALLRALAWCSPLAVFWLGGTTVLFGSSTALFGPSTARGNAVLLGLSALAAGAEAGAETYAAWRQGPEYLPSGPRMLAARVLGVAGRAASLAGRGIQSTGRRLGPTAFGCLILVVSPFVLALVLTATFLVPPLWLVMLITVPAGHWAAALVRVSRWREREAQL